MMRIFLLLVIFLSFSGCDNASLSDATTSVTPPRPLVDMVLVDVGGEAMPASWLRNHWSYVILADAECDETCVQYIETTRTVVNEKQDQLPMQRLLVLGYNADKAFVKMLQAENPDMKIALLTRPIWAIFTVNFLQAAAEVGGAPLYLVDPRAFLVAAYDDFVEAKDLTNDLVVFKRSLDQ